MPTESEWEYLFNERTGAASKRCLVSITIAENTNGKYFEPSSGLPGMLLMPDNWDANVVESENSGKSYITKLLSNIGTNNVTALGSSQLQYLEKKYGVVFLPSYFGRGIMGDGHESNSNYPQSDFKLYSNTLYWTSTSAGYYIYVMIPFSSQGSGNFYIQTNPREAPCSVRLIRDIDF